MNHNKKDLESSIADMQDVYNDADTPKSVKESIKPSLDKAKKLLAELNAQDAKKPAAKQGVKGSGGAKKKPAAVATVKPMTAKQKKTLQQIVARSKKLAKYSGTSEKDLKRDASRKAKGPGQRISASGKKYTENRSNRSDVGKTAPYLAKGGQLSSYWDSRLNTFVGKTDDYHMAFLTQYDKYFDKVNDEQLPALVELLTTWLSHEGIPDGPPEWEASDLLVMLKEGRTVAEKPDWNARQVKQHRMEFLTSFNEVWEHADEDNYDILSELYKIWSLGEMGEIDLSADDLLAELQGLTSKPLTEGTMYKTDETGNDVFVIDSYDADADTYFVSEDGQPGSPEEIPRADFDKWVNDGSYTIVTPKSKKGKGKGKPKAAKKRKLTEPEQYFVRAFNDVWEKSDEDQQERLSRLWVRFIEYEGLGEISADDLAYEGVRAERPAHTTGETKDYRTGFLLVFNLIWENLRNAAEMEDLQEMYNQWLMIERIDEEPSAEDLLHMLNEGMPITYFAKGGSLDASGLKYPVGTTFIANNKAKDKFTIMSYDGKTDKYSVSSDGGQPFSFSRKSVEHSVMSQEWKVAGKRNDPKSNVYPDGSRFRLGLYGALVRLVSYDKAKDEYTFQPEDSNAPAFTEKRKQFIKEQNLGGYVPVEDVEGSEETDQKASNLKYPVGTTFQNVKSVFSKDTIFTIVAHNPDSDKYTMATQGHEWSMTRRDVEYSVLSGEWKVLMPKGKRAPVETYPLGSRFRLGLYGTVVRLEQYNKEMDEYFLKHEGNDNLEGFYVNRKLFMKEQSVGGYVPVDGTEQVTYQGYTSKHLSPDGISAFQEAIRYLDAEEDKQSEFYGTATGAMKDLLRTVDQIMESTDPVEINKLLQVVGIRNYRTGLLLKTDFLDQEIAKKSMAASGKMKFGGKAAVNRYAKGGEAAGAKAAVNRMAKGGEAAGAKAAVNRYAKGGSVKRNVGRDRKFKSQEPHEQRYQRKTTPKNPTYNVKAIIKRLSKKKK